MKRKLKLYICGKVTGDPNYKDKFRRAEYRLRVNGYDVENPAEAIPADTEWHDAMKKALKIMLDCDGVATLPDFADSNGAVIETDLASKIAIKVASVKKWIRESTRERAKLCLECKHIEDSVTGFCKGRYGYSRCADGTTSCDGFKCEATNDN